MTLSDFERNSALWKRITDHANERLGTLRLKNDGEFDAIETAKLRGRIAELKVLIALGDKPSPIEVADEH